MGEFERNVRSVLKYLILFKRNNSNAHVVKSSHLNMNDMVAPRRLRLCIPAHDNPKNHEVRNILKVCLQFCFDDEN